MGLVQLELRAAEYLSWLRLGGGRFAFLAELPTRERRFLEAMELEMVMPDPCLPSAVGTRPGPFLHALVRTLPAPCLPPSQPFPGSTSGPSRFVRVCCVELFLNDPVSLDLRLPGTVK